MKKASGDMLVESLAPFLIMAEETSFFGYGWFYDIETGYAPCDGKWPSELRTIADNCGQFRTIAGNNGG